MSSRPAGYLPPSDEMLGFLHGIKEEPEDDVSAQVFADWLEEQQDPRGTLIRLECELSSGRLSEPEAIPLAQKEQELRRQFYEWLEPLPRWASVWKVSRGLIQLELRASGQLPKRCQELGEKEWWPWVGLLTFQDDQFTPVDLRRIVNKSYIAHLGTLQLEHKRAGDNAIVALLDSPYLNKLCGLALKANDLGVNAMKAMAKCDLSNLVVLDLSVNDLGPYGIRALSGSASFSRLRSLSLTSCDGKNIGATALAASTAMPHLQYLDLWGNGIEAQGAVALAESPHRKELTTLLLGHNMIGVEGAQAIARSPHLAKLQRLDLWKNGIGTEGAMALVESPYLTQLTELDLGDNRISDSAKKAIVDRFGSQCHSLKLD